MTKPGRSDFLAHGSAIAGSVNACSSAIGTQTPSAVKLAAAVSKLHETSGSVAFSDTSFGVSVHASPFTPEVVEKIIKEHSGEQEMKWHNGAAAASMGYAVRTLPEISKLYADNHAAEAENMEFLETLKKLLAAGDACVAKILELRSENAQLTADIQVQIVC